jgi:trehalose/maltose hydrolase-like predicted phosphorylase
MSGDEELSWEMYQEALASDYNDIQGGTTGEGIHVGVMAGTVMIALTTYAGINFKGEHLAINPDLPDLWRALAFSMLFKGTEYTFEVGRETLKVRTAKTQQEAVITVYDKEYRLSPNEWITISL